ncbi:hypothetical protein MCOR27_006653 [Pyricularia oryzae]|uniref:Peptidase A1 domain-containing protein n=2 Tax=Pyricularia TaxID=48558 RepID=A0ABQ8NAA9_PYRGI|nr:hypothetical protein MCOR01_009885 [Pyricularia oryzae]KAI6293871.1 hypothetical protein MCOR33_008829 [Pyricularia grisea]KAH9436813.1 hypothetical protein MCOR02_000478 [Pyricularia oryzae]KAI6263230.1 hypothetical protein MCOR19_000556 [Pyricularia oryzae]KAI6276071.1 hypothetical protein MCOR27_006653 [Pyricularia oryzae]
MPSLKQTLTWAVAAAALAVATPVDTKVGTLSLNQEPNPKFEGKSGLHAMVKVFRKYGKPLPETLAAALANATASVTRRDGSAVTTPEAQDTEYLTPVQIGTPPVTLNLDFDTGSSDLWVFSSDLSASLRSGHSFYTPSKSSTSSKQSGQTWSIKYGDGSGASGNVYSDVVSIGGVKFASQAVETASKISTQFTQDTDNDGLVGLAFSSINTVSPKKQKTFFDNVKNSLTKPIIGVNLKAGAPGSYDFGFANTNSYTGSIAYVPVDNSQGFWSFTASGYSIGSSSSRTQLTGIADTGTTLLLLPPSVVNAYYKQVRGAVNDNSAGGFVFDCNANLPTFSFNVGSNTITIPGSIMNFAPVGDGSNNCFGGLQVDTGIGLSIFGDIALKAAYVVFDNSPSPRLGWANKNL